MESGDADEVIGTPPTWSEGPAGYPSAGLVLLVPAKADADGPAVTANDASTPNTAILPNVNFRDMGYPPTINWQRPLRTVVAGAGQTV
jgi:hypothetical protein